MRPCYLVEHLVVGVRELRRLEVRRGRRRVREGGAVVRRRLRPRAGRGAVLVLTMLTLVMMEYLRMMLVLGPPSVVDLIRYHARIS